MSQESLSLATGVHRNYIGGIERGERSPSVLTVATLAEALTVSLADLFAEAEACRVTGIPAPSRDADDDEDDRPRPPTTTTPAP